MNDSFSAHANTHFNNPKDRNPLGGGASTFDQFGSPQRDNDPEPHSIQGPMQQAEIFDVGATLDVSNVDDLGELLDEGIYNFQVTKAELVDYFPKAGGKLPACTEMDVRLRLMAPTGAFGYTTARFYFVKDQMQLKKLKDFYISIGLMDPSATSLTVQPADACKDRYGRAKVSVHDYTDRNGNKRQSNQVDWFTQLDPDDPIPGVEMGNNTQVPF
mgnify:CR=1 FL=1